MQRHLLCFGPGELCGDNGASWAVKTIVCVGAVSAELQQTFWCFIFLSIGKLHALFPYPPFFLHGTLPTHPLSYSINIPSACLSSTGGREKAVTKDFSFPQTGSRDHRLTFQMCLNRFQSLHFDWQLLCLYEPLWLHLFQCPASPCVQDYPEYFPAIPFQSFLYPRDSYSKCGAATSPVGGAGLFWPALVLLQGLLLARRCHLDF